MTRQEIQELINELLRKEEMQEPLTVCELTILDVYKGLKKKGKEITEYDIQEIRFMMD